MALHLPPIVKAAERLQVAIEHAVARFTRSFRYTFGTDLRKLALKVTVLAHRAWREVEDRARLVERLSRKVDELKLLLQLGSQLRAFTSFGQFEVLSRQAVDLGKQVGGWLRQLQHPQGQSGQRGAAGQRPKTLSTRAASQWANA
jgi:hypothetical protein